MSMRHVQFDRIRASLLSRNMSFSLLQAEHAAGFEGNTGRSGLRARPLHPASIMAFMSFPSPREFATAFST